MAALPTPFQDAPIFSSTFYFYCRSCCGVYTHLCFNFEIHCGCAIDRLESLLSRRSNPRHKKNQMKNDGITSEAEQDDIYVERIRLQNMELRFSFYCFLNLFKITC